MTCFGGYVYSVGYHLELSPKDIFLFSYKIFRVSYFTFKFMIHFELIFFVCSIKIRSKSFFLRLDVQLFQPNCWKENYTFYIEFTFAFLSKINWAYLCWCIFCSLHSVPTIYGLIFLQQHIVLIAVVIS